MVLIHRAVFLIFVLSLTSFNSCHGSRIIRRNYSSSSSRSSSSRSITGSAFCSRSATRTTAPCRCSLLAKTKAKATAKAYAAGPRNTRSKRMIMAAEATEQSSSAASSSSLTPQSPSSTAHVKTPYKDNLIYMGITRELDELPVGQSIRKSKYLPPLHEERISTDTSCIAPDSDTDIRTIEIHKLSQKPPIFHLKNILSEEECDYIQNLSVETETFEAAKTRLGGDDTTTKRKKCYTAWLSKERNDTNEGHNGSVDYSVNDKAKSKSYSHSHSHPHSHSHSHSYTSIHSGLAKTIHELFLPFEQPFHDLYSVEEMQVVKYDTDGEFTLHHDGAGRLLTVIYYINGVSETWFPLADLGYRTMSLEEALGAAEAEAEVVELLQEGQEQQQEQGRGQASDVELKGVLLTSNKDDKREKHTIIEKGDAVAFYNYFQDASMEWNAIHAGLKAEKAKWIATHWYHHVPKSLRTMTKTAPEVKQ